MRKISAQSPKATKFWKTGNEKLENTLLSTLLLPNNGSEFTAAR